MSIITAAAFLGRNHLSSPAVALLVAAVALGCVSFADDLFCLPASVRLTVQIVTSLSLCLAIDSLSSNWALGNGWAGKLAVYTCVCVWLVGYTNAFNFMDGINGLAAGQATLTALGMATIAASATGTPSGTSVLLCWLIAGAAAGFVPHNFPTARMFMGDVGSAPLGYLLAGSALLLAQEKGWLLLVPLLLLHTNFVLDTGVTLLRRIAAGEKWYEAHREHFYQRLIRSGKSHVFVTGVQMGLQIAVLILLLGYTRVELAGRIGIIFAVICLWLAFFAYCEVQFRRANVRASQPGRDQAAPAGVFTEK